MAHPFAINEMIWDSIKPETLTISAANKITFLNLEHDETIRYRPA
jgi:hypothetical protein